MEWLFSPSLQGIAALLAIIQFVILIWANISKSNSSSQPKQGPTSPGEAQALPNRGLLALGLVVMVALGWLLFSIPWVLLYAMFGMDNSPIMTPVFLVYGSCPPIGVLLVRRAVIGGALGGGLPMGAVFGVREMYESTAVIGEPFTLFVTGVVMGGLVGAVSGPATIKLVRYFNLPLPG